MKFKFKLIKLEDLCGKRATVYSVVVNDEEQTLFDRFINENFPKYQKELTDISDQIDAMATVHGLRDNFFKKREGRPGDGVEALFSKQLRLYCMRFGHVILILGGGGPKNTRTWEEDAKLDEENRLLQKFSSLLTEKMRNKETKWSLDATELIGDLEFGDEDLTEDD